MGKNQILHSKQMILIYQSKTSTDHFNTKLTSLKRIMLG